MSELTFEQAKELSEKKWKYIAKNNGNTSGVFEEIPELSVMAFDCAMCQFFMFDKNLNCDECIYDEICSTVFQDWNSEKTKKTANVVLKTIQETNKQYSNNIY